jgi:hypothetical protein
MAYTSEQLDIICPACRACRGGKCLDEVLWGSKYIDEPHEERVQKAAKGSYAGTSLRTESLSAKGQND